MAELVADVPERRAVLLAERRPDLLALGRVGLVEIERDQPVEVADRRRVAGVRRSIGEQQRGPVGPSPSLGDQSMPSTLSWASARRWAARNGTSRVLSACSPASTMRQLAQIPFACGRQLHRHESRIRHVPTTAASPIVSDAVDADLERQLGVADDAPQRVEEHLVATRRARQSLHIVEQSG